MGSSVRRLVISGYYGFNNSGDEAVLCSILAALRDQTVQTNVKIEPIVLSANPVQTTQMYGVQAVHRMKLNEVFSAIRKSDGLISGGGSLLQDVTSNKTIPYYLGILKLAQWLGKSTFIYAQGIGPIQKPLFHKWVKKVFERCQYISVRDTASLALLKKMGLKNHLQVDQVPDPVMGMSEGVPSKYSNDVKQAEEQEKIKVLSNDKQKKVIGVSVRFWNEDRSELNKIAKALKLLREKESVIIKMLPFHMPHDQEASLYIIQQMGLSDKELPQDIQFSNEDNPIEMLKEVSTCDVLIGMRLHSLIYAANNYVPMVGISYDPKIDRFLEQMQMTPVGSTTRLDEHQIVDNVYKLMVEYDDWLLTKQALINNLKEMSQKPAQHIGNFYVYKDGE
ncbi:polysaccharide pyruvyl transferase CsaB [Chengkuizengella marina]|uniref:Polysaccharide pyruvyl transferase CsaB n=1 Tax=Chengkuizengella marina TaxID=2507566 RepID=A0A6N9Q799_9BACL|nr:polysaccharide pyruvyl transferase CsaB [Chengkuizengella marina]NBI30581.1 polysaccharide pyruvyl transferase CsaB [Chengkuizengella marina]